MKLNVDKAFPSPMPIVDRTGERLLPLSNADILRKLRHES
jgi:hypothetical protein